MLQLLLHALRTPHVLQRLSLASALDDGAAEAVAEALRASPTLQELVSCLTGALCAACILLLCHADLSRPQADLLPC